jgi:hypothetical protein
LDLHQRARPFEIYPVSCSTRHKRTEPPMTIFPVIAITYTKAERYGALDDSATLWGESWVWVRCCEKSFDWSRVLPSDNGAGTESLTIGGSYFRSLPEAP